MILKDKRQIGILLLANIAAIYANGQNYNDRNTLHTGIAIDDDDEYLINTEYYQWSRDQDEPEILRWNVEKYPHPHYDYRFCNRFSPGNVCDPDRIITREQGSKLNSIIKQIFNDSKCICQNCDSGDGGIQIGIALLKNTFQPYMEHQSKVIRSFTENLRSKWNLGTCEDDILIVVAIDDRQSYTDVGRTAAQYISKEEAYRVFNESKRFFSRGDYYDGLNEMLHNYQNLAKNFAKKKDKPELSAALLSGIIVVIAILIGVIIIISVICYKRASNRKGIKVSHIAKEDEDTEPSPGWRHRSIKTLFTTFKSTNDAYQPCKTNEGKLTDDKGSNLPPLRDGDEILNLELALPDPVTEVKDEYAEIFKQPSQDNSEQENPINENEQPINVEIIQINNGIKHIQPINDEDKNVSDPTSSEETENSTHTENNKNPFETFAQSAHKKELQQTDL